MTLRAAWRSLLAVVLTVAATMLSACTPAPPDPAPDFDNDGFADVAIGVPGENGGAGQVNVLYGTAQGAAAARNQAWSQAPADVPGAAEAGDHFGAAVATGDFNRDGFSDLAVGAPEEDETPATDSGAVNVLYGSADGLTATGSQLWTQVALADAPEDGDRLGAALAAGDMNGDGYADLAIGAPSEAIGLIPLAGAVNVVYGSASRLTATGNQIWHQDRSDPGGGEVQGAAAERDQFGASLAVADLAGGDEADLVVGVPNDAVGAKTGVGAVNVILGSPAPTGLRAAGNQLWHQDRRSGEADEVQDVAEVGDGFGRSLAVGDFGRDASLDLAVGVPGETVGSTGDAGAVNVLYGLAGSVDGLSASGNQLWHQDSSSGGADVQDQVQPSDRFGQSLAAADLGRSGQADLAIGAPQESTADHVNALHVGVVHVLYGSGDGLTAAGNQLWQQGSPVSGPDTEVEGEFGPFERFGRSLATGNIGRGRGADLVIGVNDRVPDITGSHVGAVNILYGSANGLTSTDDQLWHQGNDGLFDDSAEDGDDFGAALTGSGS